MSKLEGMTVLGILITGVTVRIDSVHTVNVYIPVDLAAKELTRKMNKSKHKEKINL